MTDNDITITEEFQTAFRMIEAKEPFVFITGRAGTGKSTFIELLKNKLTNFAVVSPTGVAALNVGGQTIHSFFQLRHGHIDISRIFPVKYNQKYLALETLIIDEISMVRADMLDVIDMFLKVNRSCRSLPFGGVQVIAVGDLFQLPPIVAGAEEKAFIEDSYKGNPFFFSAKCLTEVNINRIEFKEIFRQKEQDFINLLNGVREGKDIDKVITSLNSRVFPSDHGFEGMILTTTNKVAENTNASRLKELEGEEKLFKGRLEGKINLDTDKLPAPYELVLKEGAQVMFVKNSKNNWVNGTLGIVTGFTKDDRVKVKIKEDDVTREVIVGTEEWENFKYDYSNGSIKSEVIGKYIQLPLMLAWAVTIHKSQGKTFDEAHIDLGWGAFSDGQVYVALSRCRTLKGITLETPIKHTDITVNDKILEFEASR